MLSLSKFDPPHMLSLLALLHSETGVTRMLAPQRAADQGSFNWLGRPAGGCLREGRRQNQHASDHHFLHGCPFVKHPPSDPADPNLWDPTDPSNSPPVCFAWVGGGGHEQGGQQGAPPKRPSRHPRLFTKHYQLEITRFGPLSTIATPCAPLTIMRVCTLTTHLTSFSDD